MGQSKAVGEPPFMLGISALMALSDAVAACGDGSVYPALDAPGDGGAGAGGGEAAARRCLTWPGLQAAVAAQGRVARVVIAGVEGSVRARSGRRCWSGTAGSRAPSAAARWNGRRSARARDDAGAGRATRLDRVPLGPALGQCCGGAVTLLTEVYDAATLAALAGRRGRAAGGRAGDAAGGEAAAGAGAGRGRGARAGAGAGLDGGAGGAADARGLGLGRGACGPRAGGGAGAAAGAGDHLGRCGGGPVSGGGAGGGDGAARRRSGGAGGALRPRRPSIWC